MAALDEVAPPRRADQCTIGDDHLTTADRRDRRAGKRHTVVTREWKRRVQGLGRERHLLARIEQDDVCVATRLEPPLAVEPEELRRTRATHLDPTAQGDASRSDAARAHERA